jgi:hypothetical protein
VIGATSATDSKTEAGGVGSDTTTTEGIGGWMTGAGAGAANGVAAAGGGGETAALGGGNGILVPHLMQNLALSSTSAEQLGHFFIANPLN